MNRVLNASRRLVLMIGLVMFGSVAMSPAMAATIIYNFTGTVNGVGAQLSPGPSFTSTTPNMKGTITVDTTDTASGGVNGSYSIQSFTVQIGSYTASAGPSGTVNIRNGSGGGPGADRFEVTVNPLNGLNGDSVNFFAPRLFGIELRGPNSPSSIFGSDALPNPAPSLSSFTNRNEFRLQFGPGNTNNRAVSGVLTSLTAVPLPAAVVLFGAGLVALIGLGAGGLRNLRVPQA